MRDASRLLWSFYNATPQLWNCVGCGLPIAALLSTAMNHHTGKTGIPNPVKATRFRKFAGTEILTGWFVLGREQGADVTRRKPHTYAVTLTRCGLFRTPLRVATPNDGEAMTLPTPALCK
ncbi:MULTISPECIES: hypothetical protein [unclassified Mesorhizobium]|uniref:hypothetical protein n=1 Tax=unclassified Mesorhizobium TaxID=325217 RepID=UPI00163DC11F|nr:MULTISPECIES: hypothetical protein [unclassified Mesorhizobium]